LLYFFVATKSQQKNITNIKKGMLIFLRLDQRLEAEKVGLSLRPTQLLLFGNPKAGTLLMNASTSIAIDLPLLAEAIK
jgi:uncharacterized protein (DUF302 family)